MVVVQLTCIKDQCCTITNKDDAKIYHQTFNLSLTMVFLFSTITNASITASYLQLSSLLQCFISSSWPEDCRMNHEKKIFISTRIIYRHFSLPFFIFISSWPANRISHKRIFLYQHKMLIKNQSLATRMILFKGLTDAIVHLKPCYKGKTYLDWPLFWHLNSSCLF